MPKTTPVWNPADYATVAERIIAFYAAFPFGRIVTELAARTDRQVTFKASIYRSVEEAYPSATGWASEREGDGDVNAVACLENAETSAVGRALANLGFSASRTRAGRDDGPSSARRGDERRVVRLVHEPGPADARGADVALQRAADALLDALTLLQEAERCGLPAEDARRIRAALDGRSVAPSAIRRAERELRAWFDRRGPDVPPPATPA